MSHCEFAAYDERHSGTHLPEPAKVPGTKRDATGYQPPMPFDLESDGPTGAPIWSASVEAIPAATLAA
ncbi:hypothetical protein [Sphingomonas profundi]|uniref:hypothetical protein n=1 Tax=Alterirhizorhabdus profundi TaxID=2681549 RepID=UPI0012E930B3|nr:hypothetical protein [Sphingomonas profundi]